MISTRKNTSKPLVTHCLVNNCLWSTFGHWQWYFSSEARSAAIAIWLFTEKAQNIDSFLQGLFVSFLIWIDRSWPKSSSWQKQILLGCVISDFYCVENGLGLTGTSLMDRGGKLRTCQQRSRSSWLFLYSACLGRVKKAQKWFHDKKGPVFSCTASNLWENVLETLFILRPCAGEILITPFWGRGTWPWSITNVVSVFPAACLCFQLGFGV